VRRALALAAIFAVGIAASLALTVRPARAALSCATDTTAAVAAATATNLGLSWSSPANPDPLWDVNMPALNMSLSVYAPNEAGARVAAKASLDSQIAGLGCATTTTATATTTTAATATTVTVTTPAPTPEPVAPVVVFVPTPGPSVTHTETTTVAAPAAPAPPVNVSVVVHVPPAPNVTVDLADATCTVAGKRVPCSKLADGRARQVRIVATWHGKKITVRKVAG
jgi:hypothetical protein